MSMRSCHVCGEPTDHYRCDTCQLQVNQRVARDLLGFVPRAVQPVSDSGRATEGELTGAT